MATEAQVFTREKLEAMFEKLLSPEYRAEVMQQKTEEELKWLRALGMFHEQ